MRELDPRRDSMHKMMIAVAAALSLGTATIATDTMAFWRGDGGSAVAEATLSAEAEGTLAAEVILASAAVSAAVSGVVISAEALGAALAACMGSAA